MVSWSSGVFGGDRCTVRVFKAMQVGLDEGVGFVRDSICVLKRGGQVGCLGGERVVVRRLRRLAAIGARCAVEGVKAECLGFIILELGFGRDDWV